MQTSWRGDKNCTNLTGIFVWGEQSQSSCPFVKMSAFHSALVFYSFARYDPKENKWTRVASMSTRRLGVAVAVLGGFLYAVGGSDGTSPLNTGMPFAVPSSQPAFVLLLVAHHVPRWLLNILVIALWSFFSSLNIILPYNNSLSRLVSPYYLIVCHVFTFSVLHLAVCPKYMDLIVCIAFASIFFFKFLQQPFLL